MTDKPDEAKTAQSDRRDTDRRKSASPFEGPDRRVNDRRSGKDRRDTDRS